MHFRNQRGSLSLSLFSPTTIGDTEELGILNVETLSQSPALSGCAVQGPRSLSPQLLQICQLDLQKGQDGSSQDTTSLNLPLLITSVFRQSGPLSIYRLDRR